MNKRKILKLDFIGIGAERSGTTWVSNILKEHPEICFSSEKEIYFFNKLDRHFLRIENKRYARGMDWYESFFSQCSPQAVKGEFTPTYLFDSLAPLRIKSKFPNVKIIAVLRNPVERAFSQYLHNLRSGLIPQISFEKALERMDSYIEKGFYFKHLARYYRLFPRRNIKIILLDDIEKNPKSVVKDLYKFLNLRDVNYTPASMLKKINQALKSKWHPLNYVLINIEVLLKKAEFDAFLRVLENTGIRKIFYDLNHYVNVEPLKKYPRIKKNTRRKLIGIYLSDIKKLEKLLKRDLKSWTKLG